MEAVTSVAELREQIELSGAEVLSNYFHNSGKQLSQPRWVRYRYILVGVNNCIWADHFAIGAVAK